MTRLSTAHLSDFKTLLIHSNPENAALIKNLFVSGDAAKECCLTTLHDLIGLQSLPRKNYDIILFDLYFWKINGPASFTKLRSRFSSVPIIVMVDRVDMTFAIEAIKLGADDYLVFGEFGENEILNTIQRVVEKKHIFSDWKTVVDNLFIKATQDPLTGLANRILFLERLKIAIYEAQRHDEPLGIIFIDLDNFKEINDKLGHEVGDKVLVSVSARLHQMLRAEDTLARLGGDEFVALIRRAHSCQEISAISDRLQNAFERPLFNIDGRPVCVKGSIGVSVYPFDGQDEASLLKHADTAMFRVKRKSGNAVEFYSEQEKYINERGEKKMESKQKVLVIDDDSDFRSVLRRCLQTAGYECVCISSVEEALEQVSDIEPDLVILDLGLRQASGVAFLENVNRYMKKDQKVPPILVVSGYSDNEIVQFVKNLGATRFITKPVGTAQIVSAVRSYIQ